MRLEQTVKEYEIGPLGLDYVKGQLAKGSWYPGIGVLTSVTNADPIQDRAVVSESVLVELAQNADCILIQAWDQEAWLLWRPSN